MDHDAKNDSGTDSGSETMPYSPCSNRSENRGTDYLSMTSQVSTSVSPPSCFTEYITLRPIESEPTALPETSSADDKLDATSHQSPLTCNSTDVEMDEPIKLLENICTSSGISSECSTEGQSEIDQYENQDLKTSKINSRGKVRTFKCKQCGFLAYTKPDFWNHIREHIAPDKQLNCPNCLFVTEFKHHLEYHLRNHDGTKPHKCPKCPYTCVSKSMLNSHSKSHSNIYRYRCGECPYASKYCHSLKRHSRKYNHKPGVVLDEDGSPNPQQFIDVYGTRRGTKVKKQKPRPTVDIPPLTQMLLNESSQLQVGEQPEDLSVPRVSSEPSQVSPVHDILMESSTDFPVVPGVSRMPSVSIEPPEFQVNDIGALDLSMPRIPSPPAPNNDNSSKDLCVVFSNVEAIHSEHSDQEVAETTSLKCQFCDIGFGRSIMYTLHMGLHGCENPFKCVCGHECNDRISFYIHSVRVPHLYR